MIIGALLLAGYPMALSCAVRLHTPAGAVGWGVPISPLGIATVAHLASDPSNRVDWRDSTDGEGTANVVWRDKKTDLAILIKASGPEFHCIVSRAGKTPEIQDRLCWTGYLAGNVPAIFCGAYVGTDRDGDLALDGWSHPGCSGAPVLNERGELVGLITQSGNWSDAFLDTDDLHVHLEVRSLFRSMTFAQDVTGKKSPWDVHRESK
jgi:hypothetical protein